MTSPIVSILMPVHNATSTLEETLRSLAEQTFRDYEIVAVENGSTDDSLSMLQKWADRDERIKVVHLDEGNLAKALNHGLTLVKGRYVARMDADDIALPQRLERQVDYLSQHPEVAVCGTQVILWNGDQETKSAYPETDGEIRSRLLFENTMAHPSVMLNREKIPQDLFIYRLYDGEYQAAEDYEWWCRLARNGCRFYNLKSFEVKYRRHAAQSTQQVKRKFSSSSSFIRQEHMTALGLFRKEEDKTIHDLITHWQSHPNFEGFQKAYQWLNFLQEFPVESWGIASSAWHMAVRNEKRKHLARHTQLGLKIFKSLFLKDIIDQLGYSTDPSLREILKRALSKKRAIS